MSSLNGSAFVSLSDNVASVAVPSQKSYKPTRLAAKDRFFGQEVASKKKKPNVSNVTKQRSSSIILHNPDHQSSSPHSLRRSSSQSNIKTDSSHQTHHRRVLNAGKGGSSIDQLTNLTDEKLQILNRVEVSSLQVCSSSSEWPFLTLHLLFVAGNDKRLPPSPLPPQQ